MEVSVSEPTKNVNGGFGTYITYKVVTKTQRIGFESFETTVIRRFRHFSWLIEELIQKYPFAIIPTLPDKQSTQTLLGYAGTDEFVEKRRRCLERLLKRIADHPVLGYSKDFIVFLQGNDAVLNETIQATYAGKSMTDKAKSWFHGTKNSIFAATTKQAELEKTAGDSKVDDMNKYLILLEKQIESLYKHSESIAKNAKEVSISLTGFSESIALLGQSEHMEIGGDEMMGNAFVEGAANIQKVSIESELLWKKEMLDVVEPLEEYMRYISAIHAIIEKRAYKRTVYRDAIQDFRVKEGQYQKVMGLSGKEKEAVAKQDAVEKANLMVQSVKTEYEQFTEQFVNEFARFKIQKTVDMRAVLLTFATLEADFSSRSEKIWSSLLPVLESVNMDSKSALLLNKISAPTEINVVNGSTISARPDSSRKVICKNAEI